MSATHFLMSNGHLPAFSFGGSDRFRRSFCKPQESFIFQLFWGGLSPNLFGWVPKSLRPHQITIEGKSPLLLFHEDKPTQGPSNPLGLDRFALDGYMSLDSLGRKAGFLSPFAASKIKSKGFAKDNITKAVMVVGYTPRHYGLFLSSIVILLYNYLFR